MSFASQTSHTLTRSPVYRHRGSRFSAALALGVTVMLSGPAQAQEPLDIAEEVVGPVSTVTVYNFTADWCPNCQVLNPRLEDAVSRFEPGEVTVIDLDLTESQSSDEDRRVAAFEMAKRQVDANGVSYLWDWYGGITGLAVLVSSDNGEPISCANRSLSTDEIERRLREAVLLSLRMPAGARKPNGPDCPPPID